MGFRLTYEEILELLRDTVLNTSIARDIVRRSGYRPGQATFSGDLGGLIPPGGNPGDILQYSFDTGSGPPPPEDWIPEWHKPAYLVAYEAGEPEPYTRPWLGDARGIPLYTFSARNPDYTVGIASTNDDREDNVVPVEDASSREELLVWENVPAGFWYYPYNVEWFVTKRELARAGQYSPREIKIRCGWVGGSPDATLHFSYSTSGTGSWTSLVSVDLSGGGAKNSGWVPFNEAASGDVYLGLFVDVGGTISSLHMAPIEVLIRWAPRGVLRPSEFT